VLQIHVVLSLVGIAIGLVMVYRMLTGGPTTGATVGFLVTTILTSITGFPLAPFGFDPPRAVGILSLLLLAAAVVALYGFRLAGPWRWIFCVTAIAALYLNVFVGVVQAFQKTPFLHALAPTQSELPFLVAQLAVLAGFVVLGAATLLKYRPTIPATV
jgi:hypothetical protein